MAGVHIAVVTGEQDERIIFKPGISQTVQDGVDMLIDLLGQTMVYPAVNPLIPFVVFLAHGAGWSDGCSTGIGFYSSRFTLRYRIVLGKWG